MCTCSWMPSTPGHCPGLPGAGAGESAEGDGRAGGCGGAVVACGAPVRGGLALSLSCSGPSRPAIMLFSEKAQPLPAPAGASGGAVSGAAVAACSFCSWTRRSQSLKRARHLRACETHCHTMPQREARASELRCHMHVRVRKEMMLGKRVVCIARAHQPHAQSTMRTRSSHVRGTLAYAQLRVKRDDYRSDIVRV